MKKNKILSFLLTLLVAFIASISAVNASGWKTEESRCYDHPERALTIHYIVDGKEVNPGDPNAGSWYGLSSSKRNPCTSYSIPEGYYNYNTGFGKSQKMFTNEDGTRGIIYWYDNPEFTGSPVISISYTQIPESREITLYGKTGPIIEVYANGYKKKVVVGRKYSPMTMDPDYYVSTGITHNGTQSVNYWKYSTEADYFAYASDHGEYNSNPTYTYYRDRTYVRGGSSMLAMPAKYVHVDNTELIQFINYESCYGNDDYLYCKIADPETGEPMTDAQVQEMLDDEYAYSTVYIHDYSRIPKYYKYFGFIDTQGREYTPEFVMEQEYEGRAFTTIVDGKMSCATDYISPYSSSSYVAKVYNTGITFDGAEFSGDFNTNYLTKLKTYSSNTYYDNDKTNYQFSSCVPYDVNFKYTYKITNPNARWYNVVIEGTDGERVTPGSTYTLPTEGKPKSAEVTVVTLKYQDGETPDDRLVYTKTYTPSGFKIDGVHYDFGQEIVVTRDLYITYDYTFELDGPDLPTPTRENYSFKGWYDMTIGGHLITNPKTLEAKILYAQWNDADTVTIVRPDGIPIELEKGSEYIIPEIYDKDEVVNSKVSFNYNDRSGKVDVSEVITYYAKDGVIDTLHNNQRYACGEKIIANDNMVLVANYVETVKPAKFPSDPERYGHEFLGWFDGVTSSSTKYTEYAGNQDLNLYAHWETYIDQISIHYPDYEPYNGATITIDKGENYTLSNILTNNTDLHDVTFNFNDAGLGDSTTPNQVQSVGISKVGNGWFVDGVLYAGGSVITPENDIWLIEDTIDVEYEPIFPTPADKEWYTFNGWYDEKTGGTKYTSYNVAEEKTFYAHWDEIPSKEITLGEVPSKADTNAATVVFNYNDGVTNNVTRYVTKSYIADGWIVDGEHYYPGDKVTITRTSSITPNYLESLNDVTFPSNPTREGYTFKGWYDTDATSGGKKYSSYAKNEEITLYARWIENSSSNILCQRYTAMNETQHSNDELVAGDAFICDVNGDGNFNSFNELFWYVSDYYDTHTKEFNNDYAALIYDFNTYNRGISGVDDMSTFCYSGNAYSCQSVSNGPSGALLGLPTTEWWSNTSLYQTERNILTVNGNNSDGSTNLPTNFSYEGKAARLITTQEISAACGKNITTDDYQLSLSDNSCGFLGNNLSDVIGEGVEPYYTYHVENVIDGYSSSELTFAVNKNSIEFDVFDGVGVRPVIDVPKSRIEGFNTPDPGITYTITYPDGTKEEIEDGETFTFPNNSTVKNDINVASVTFKYNNGHEDTISNVKGSYLGNGWKIGNVHYDEGDSIVVNEDITLEYDYIEVITEPITGATFPSDPSRDGYEFGGWYDVNTPAGGNNYTSYNGSDDLILYARWNEVENAALCRRSVDVVEGVNQNPFGNDSFTPGVYRAGDIFICDVNGDGVWDDATERFYYISDYYDAQTNTFDENTAALVFFANYNVDHFNELPTEYESYYDDNSFRTEYSYDELTINGPTKLINYLPSTSLWSNVTLKNTNRKIVGSNGETTSGSYTYGYANYEGKAARLLTAQEVTHGCNSTLENALNTEACAFLQHNATHRVEWEESEFGSEPYVTYEDWYALETPYSYDQVYYSYSSLSWDFSLDGMFYNNGAAGLYGIRPVIDVPKSSLTDSTEDPIVGPVPGNKYTITYPDGTTELVNEGDTFVFPTNKATIPDETLATVTFKYNNGHEDTTSYVKTTYVANGWKIGDTHYDDKAELVVTSDLTLAYDYIITTSGAEFPSNPTKDGYTFNGWYGPSDTLYTSYNEEEDIILYAKWDLQLPAVGEEYTLPVNNEEKVSEYYKVTFNKLNGSENIVRNVEVRYTPNGWLVNNEPHSDGDVITITNNINITRNYTESIIPVTFPSNPTRENDVFTGWFDSEFGGTKYTSYDKKVAITLYAHYVAGANGPYILPRNTDTKDSVVRGTITFKYHNGSPDTTSSSMKTFKPHGWLVDGVFHENGDTVNRNESTVIEPYFDEFIQDVEFPAVPTRTGYEFVGWYTEENGGTKVTTHKGTDDITLHAHWTNDYALLIPGFDSTNKGFYQKLTNLTAGYIYSAPGLTFRKATLSEYNTVQDTLTNDNLVSTSSSPKPVYLWRDGNNILYYSTADVIFVNPDASDMFYVTDTFGSLDLSGLNTSKVTNMYMFFGGIRGTIDLTNFDTTNATNMSYMFYKCYQSPDLSNFNTSKVTNMHGMFNNAQFATLDVTPLDTHNVTKMTYMFAGSGNGTPNRLTSLDLRNFDTSNVIDFNHMFYDAEYLVNVDVSNFDVSNARSLSDMFDWVNRLEGVNVRNWDVSNVGSLYNLFRRAYSIKTLDLSNFKLGKRSGSSTNIGSMFDNATNLETVYVSKKWDTTGTQSDNSMFASTTKIVGQNGTTYDPTHTNVEYARIDNAPDEPGYFTYKNTDYNYLVILPDYTEEVPEGTNYVIPANNYKKDDEILATVTFDYQDGRENYVTYIRNVFSPKGFNINGTQYNSGSTYVINENTTLVPNYTSSKMGAEFPDSTNRPGYTFLGWYTEPTGGTRIYSYKTEEDITLYAHWNKQSSGTYTLSKNNTPKSDVNYEVTFKPQNGEEDINVTITHQFTPNGWLIDGVHKDDGERVNLDDQTVVEPDYIEVVVGSFPSEPVKENDTFKGWYDAEFGGDKYSSVEEINGDIVLYAHYVGNAPDEVLCKRATTLHKYDAVSRPDNVGNLGTNGSLHVGDAFNCDVNGDGVYDESRERFYYVSKYYDVNIDDIDSDIGVLAFYTEVYNGSINNTTSVNYDDAISHLPSNVKWPNTSLHETSRSGFNYALKSARLLNSIEFNLACPGGATGITSTITSNVCPFLLENTTYAGENSYSDQYSDVHGFWLESTDGNAYAVMGVEGDTVKALDSGSTGYRIGVKPVIDVPMTQIEGSSQNAVYTVTLPDGSKDYVKHGTEYKLPTNKSIKADDIISTVTFKPLNGGEDITRYVTKSYTANGLKINGLYDNNVHYDNAVMYTVNSDITISYDYNETVNPVEYPTVTKEGFELSGWYDLPIGGSRYATYSDDEDITLYARWIVEGAGTNILCKRATTLHTETCKSEYCSSSVGIGNTVTYGQLGEANELNTGDAFNCDMNGDGIFDEQTERFYYVSDYFDTETKEFNPDYAALIYYTNTYWGNNTPVYMEDDIRTSYGYNYLLDEFYEPNLAINHLPTSDKWNNSSLYKTTRYLLKQDNSNYRDISLNYSSYPNYFDKNSANGNGYVIDPNLTSSYAARLLTYQEAYAACGQDISKCNFFKENTKFALDSEDINGEEYGMTSYYKVMEGINFETRYSDDDNWAYNVSDNAIVHQYSVTGGYSTRPVIDVAKSRIEMETTPAHKIYIDNEEVGEVVDYADYTVSLGSQTKDSENVATVTFKYNDGVTADTTSNVVMNYTLAGYKLGDTIYGDGDSITSITDDIYLTSEFVESTTPAVFPNNPTISGYNFVGWIKDEIYDPNKNQKIYKAYDGDEDLTLYAAWASEAGSHVVTYSDGEVEVVAHGTEITVPTSSINETETLTFTYLYGFWDEMMSDWLDVHTETFTQDFSSYKTVENYTVQIQTYNPGSKFTVNTDLYVTRNYNDITYDETPFEDVSGQAKLFIGWFTEETGGLLVNNYKEYKESGSTSKNIYGHHNNNLDEYTIVLDGVEVGTYNEGDTYTFPSGSNIDKDVATVTFINGEDITTAKVHETSTFTNFTLKDVYYDNIVRNPGDTLTVHSNAYITSHYSGGITPVVIPELDDKEYYDFAGWYTKENGQGVKLSGNYSGKIDITLYSYFEGKEAQYSFYDAVHENHIGYKSAKYGSVIDTSDIIPIFETTSDHTITYDYNTSDPSEVYEINMRAYQKIDHWERHLDKKAYQIVHTVDFVGPYSFDAVFDGTLVPKVELLDLDENDYPGYDFVGWYTLPVGGKIVTNEYFKEDKDYVIYAHWTRNDDNICTFSDGRTEICEEGSTLTVPEKVYKFPGFVNEIANGSLSEYKNYVVHSYDLEKTSIVEYYEIEGTKYYPGDSYTIGENSTVTVKYSDEYVEPVTLSDSVLQSDIDEFFNDNKSRVFMGWFDERTGGSRVFKYDGSDSKNFYGQYKLYDPDEEYYTLTIEYLDGSVETINNLSLGDKVKLVKDEYVNRRHVTKLYDSDESTLLGTTTVKFTHTANKYLVDGDVQDVGTNITINGDMYIKAYETSVTKEIVGYREPDSENFIGYFTAAEGGNKVDFNSIKEYDNVIDNVYAHYDEPTPEGYVKVDFDGDIVNVPAGTEIVLPTDREKDSSNIVVTFNFNQDSLEPYDLFIITDYELAGYTVNDVNKNPGNSVFANKNLVIRTKYTESVHYDDDTTNLLHVSYPDMPVFDMLEVTPTSWVKSYETNEVVEDLSNITDNTNLYAKYASEKARVYLNDEIIARVTPGTYYKLPTNDINKDSDILATVTFNHLDDNNTITTSNRYKLYTPNGWTIGSSGYNSGANYLVTEDITLVPRYKETIVEAKMPKDPVKTNANFKGWYTNLEDESTKVTSVDGITEDLTLNALFKDKVKIVDPETGGTEYVEEGTVITLESLNDKEEKYHNITFKYNYENAPSDKVVRISTQEIFKGWLINGVLHEVGEEITVNEDITKVASYETIINNKNLPNDPVRDGYTFTGWYNSASELFGSLVDVTTLTTDATVYAHWLNFNPETEVKLTWDGEVTIHDKGEVINLVKENTSYDELIATIMVLYHNSDYGTEELKVNNHHYIDHLVINGNNHEVSGTYTLNEDTVIRSAYESEIVYPSLPSIDDDDFIGFYTDTINGEAVTTLEGVNEDTVIHARWNSEHPTTNDEIIVTVDGEISLYSKGDTYNLPEAKTKPATGATVTFDPQNGEDVIVKNLGTTYTFTGYRLEEDNVLYDALESFTLENNMTFTSEFTESSEAPTWPNDPTKEHYVFIGWYTTSESGKEVFNYDDITMSTTLYAHYVRDNESFVTLTNTLTGEYIKVLSGDDFVFSDSKFNKELSTKLGTVTFKFNATGYPDEVVEFKSTNTPSGFYVNGDTNNLYSLDQAYQFTENTDITPYFSDETIVKDNHIGLDLFDYDLVNDTLSPICFSKTNQTDEYDEADYDCYEEYNEADGDVTVYLHWKDLREVSVTKPDGTVEVFPIYTNYNYGENTIPSDNGINYEVTLKYHDDIHEDEVVRYQTGNIPNGWIVTGSETGRRHIDDNEVETLVESIVIEPDYETHESTITLPNPTRDEYNFVGWNKTENGLGKFYTNEELNSVTSSGTLTLHAIWTQDETVTISFNEQGGEEVSDLTKVVGSELGTLPTTKKLGYTFAGWYTDTTYSTKVDEHTIAKYDVTYYARWIEDTFPDLFREDGPVEFDGDDYINTHVMLYSNTDDIWKQDYEIGLTIESYNHDGTEKQGAFVSAKYENQSLGYPGIVFRKVASGNKIEITQTINQTPAVKKEITLPLTYPYEVRIRREDGIVKYSLNGSSWTNLQDMSVFNANQRHDVETFFGAAASSDGITPFRFIKATMSNMYVKRGTIPGANEVTVTYPDGHTVIYDVGDTIDLSEIFEISKDYYTLGTVTFKYQDEETEDYIAYIDASYTQDGWNVEGDVSGVVGYGFDDVITLTENIKILPKYIETVEPVEFPYEPTRENYTFKGWKDINGTTYTSYSGTDDLTLYAEWEEDLVIPVPGKDDPIIVPKGSTIQLPENNVAKASENTSKVTFKPENGSSDIERYVLRAYTPNGWLINGTHYDVGDEYVANEVPILVPDYVSYIVPVEFPEDPTLTDKDFNGWYTLADGGDKITSYSDDENDLILYAQYIDHVPVIITPDGPVHPNDDGTYTFEENTINKDEELLSTVTFVYHNGDSDSYSYVVKEYIKNGWIAEGTHYNAGDTITVDHDIEIIPDYTERIRPAVFPSDPTEDGDTFTGWFSEKTGGTRYTAYSGSEDITLHAQWENGTDIDPTVLCRRARTLHTETCERTGTTIGCNKLGYAYGDTITYGSLGNGNTLARGDAFTCDVNGDGVFDEEHERFYYVNDNYSILTQTYDHDYAVMLYYGNLYDLGMINNGAIAYSTGSGDRGPNNIKTYLPTTAEWSNTSLKENTRYIYDYTAQDYFEVDYTGYAARLATFKEVANDLDGNKDDRNVILFENTQFAKRQASNGHPQYTYYLESSSDGDTSYVSTTHFNGGTGRITAADPQIGLRPVIDVPKDRIQLVDDTYTVSIDGEVVETLRAGTIYTIPENTKAKASDTYTVTFNYHNESPETTSSVEVSYLPNGYNVTDNHYNGGEKVVITGNISLTSDYIETVIPATFPADPTKEDLTFVGWFDQETGGNKYTEYSEKADIILHAQYKGDEINIIIPDEPDPIIIPVTPDEPYNLPTNDLDKADENVGSITFIYNDGSTPDLTKHVVASYTPNGWLINDVAYADGAEITPTEDITLVRNYIETITGIEWPEDPTRDGYGFDGWYTDELLEHKYTGTSYSEKADINLYAKWVEITGIEINTDDVTLIKGDEHTITVSTIPAGFTPEIVYSGYSDIITVDDTGKVTALSKGTTTITVSLKANAEINDTMTVTVLDDEITSEEYTVTTKDLTGEDIKIIIDAEPETLVKDFLDNIDNPNEYLEVYNKDNELVSSDSYENTLITTGSRLKLVINDHEYDNVLVIIRGDLNEDGKVNVADNLVLTNHILKKQYIEGYRLFAANLYTKDEEVDSEIKINVSDNKILTDYILHKTDSLNNNDD